MTAPAFNSSISFASANNRKFVVFLSKDRKLAVASGTGPEWRTEEISQPLAPDPETPLGCLPRPDGAAPDIFYVSAGKLCSCQKDGTGTWSAFAMMTAPNTQAPTPATGTALFAGICGGYRVVTYVTDKGEICEVWWSRNRWDAIIGAPAPGVRIAGGIACGDLAGSAHAVFFIGGDGNVYRVDEQPTAGGYQWSAPVRAHGDAPRAHCFAQLHATGNDRDLLTVYYISADGALVEIDVAKGTCQVRATEPAGMPFPLLAACTLSTNCRVMYRTAKARNAHVTSTGDYQEIRDAPGMHPIWNAGIAAGTENDAPRLYSLWASSTDRTPHLFEQAYVGGWDVNRVAP